MKLLATREGQNYIFQFEKIAILKFCFDMNNMFGLGFESLLSTIFV